MTPLRDVPTNKSTKESEIETALNMLQYGIEELQSKIAALSDRMVNILRASEPTLDANPPKKELPHTAMALRLEGISAALRVATTEIGNIINRCEL